MTLKGVMHSLLSLVVWFLCIPSSAGLKHSFAVNQDARNFIAPIGSPFGFLLGGCFGLDVFDFKLSVKRGRTQRSSDSKEREQAILSNVEAGFLLKRFKSESDFAEYKDAVLSNSSSCVFEAFQTAEDDPLFTDDDQFVDVGDILSAGTDGIYISLRNQTIDSAKVASVMYQFQGGEEGLYFLMYQVLMGCAAYSWRPSRIP